MPYGSREKTVEWTAEERGTYVATLVSALPHMHAVQKFLEDTLIAEPLPRDWVKARDAKGRFYFANLSTQKSSWTHPLERALRIVADVCHKCLDLTDADRDAWIRRVHATWTADAEAACAKWKPMQTADGRTYHYHEDTKESIWGHPAEREYPPYQLMLGALLRLIDKDYVKDLRRVQKLASSRSHSSTNGRRSHSAAGRRAKSSSAKREKCHSSRRRDAREHREAREYLEAREYREAQVDIPGIVPVDIPGIVPHTGYDEVHDLPDIIASSRSGDSGPHCTALLIREAEDLFASTPYSTVKTEAGLTRTTAYSSGDEGAMQKLMSRLSTGALEDSLEIEDLV